MKPTSQFRYATLAGLVSSAMLFSASRSGAEEITIPNPSFETPSVKKGWYSGSDLPASEDFIWKNNLGQYGLAGKVGNTHYSAAADGDQAVRLGRGFFVCQTLGRTTADTIYTLTFSILQSKRNPGTDAAVNVEISDGTHILASKDFTVPTEADVWEVVTLASEPVYTPTGKLSIKFTGVNAGADGVGPWIDNISLSATPASADASGKSGAEK